MRLRWAWCFTMTSYNLACMYFSRDFKIASLSRPSYTREKKATDSPSQSCTSKSMFETIHPIQLSVCLVRSKYFFFVTLPFHPRCYSRSRHGLKSPDCDARLCEPNTIPPLSAALARIESAATPPPVKPPQRLARLSDLDVTLIGSPTSIIEATGSLGIQRCHQSC